MREKILKAGWVALFVMLQMVTTVYAAAPPTYAKLSEFQLSFPPATIAADSSGSVYVSRANTNSVPKYSLDGRPLGSIALANTPYSILGGSADTLFVGQYGKIIQYAGAVEVGTITGISKPIAMSVLSNGTLFVLDADQYNVKIIAPDGTTRSVGDASVFGLSVKDLAVDETAGEFYVLDNSSQIAVGGYNPYVWRVQVFDLSGTLKRQFSFSTTGLADGTSYSLSSIAVDKSQRVYLADNINGAIFVYDNAGQFVTRIGGLPGVVNIEFANDKIYAAQTSMSPAIKRITCFGIDNFALLDVNPSAVALHVQGAYVGGDTSVSLSNSGTGQADWSAQSNPAWLQVNPLSGQVAAGAVSAVGVSADAEGMQPGQYGGNVTFAYDGRLINVPVMLMVHPPAMLTLTPANANLQVEEGSVAHQAVAISLINDLSRAMTWQAVSDSSWITLSSATGSSNTTSTIDLTINTAGLAVGQYSGKVTVTSAGTVSAATISIALTVTAKPVVVDPVEPKQPMNIIVSHAGTNESSEVAVFGADGGLLLRFIPFSYRAGANTAVGDFDGDGVADILVGTGGGNKVPAAVKGFNRDGSPKNGLAFASFPYRTGVNVAAGDFDGDKKDEIVTGDTTKTTTIRVLAYDAVAAAVTDTGVNFEAYSGQAGGVNIAVADLDGDTLPEIITAPKAGNGAVPIRIFKVDTSGGFGEWTVSLSKEFAGCGKSRGSATAGSDASAANLATADMNGDGVRDILVACGSANGTEVRVFSAAGELVRAFPTGSARLDYIAAGDVTADGIVDIVLGDGASNNMKAVRILDINGQRITGFDVFSSSAGVKVSVGDLGLQGVK